MKKAISKKTAALDSLVENAPESTRGDTTRRKKASDADEIRATFIVSKSKVQLLKDYAYIENLQIKEVFDQMIEEFLNTHFDNSKAIGGREWHDE